MPTAKVTSKGQVTIPKEIRERLQLKAGDRVRFTVDASEQVTMSADRRSILDLVGSVKVAPELRGLSQEEVDRRMREHVGEQVLKGMKP